MKKFFTGVVCGAAILAAAVVFLPVTTVKIAMLLSKPRDRSQRGIIPKTKESNYQSDCQRNGKPTRVTELYKENPL
jgi:hypothetical protein